MKTMIESLKELIDETPPELAGDVFKNGIYLCGGGSLLRRRGSAHEKEIGVEVHLADEPILCVSRGTGLMSENIGAYRNLLDNFSNSKIINL